VTYRLSFPFIKCDFGDWDLDPGRHLRDVVSTQIQKGGIGVGQLKRKEGRVQEEALGTG
jgi:hypothetical protein